MTALRLASFIRGYENVEDKPVLPVERKEMIHELKITDERYINILKGDKKAEVRLNDRDYQKGDTIVFTHLNRKARGNNVYVITHIHSGLGLEHGYVVLSLKEGIEK